MQQDCKFLPEEVILNILHRLPVKSIGQCHCICKSWHALLSKPQFIRSHLMNHIKQKHFLEESHIICINNKRFLSSISLRNSISQDLHFGGQTFSWAKIYGSCDGLVLVSNERGSKFLINPTTQEIKRVPRSPFALQGYRTVTLYGFGYDSISDDYKIVTVSFKAYNVYNVVFDSVTETFVNIYSVKNCAWKRGGSFPFDPNDRSSGVFVEGFIHFLAYKRSESDRASRFVSVIAAFDLGEEKFFEVPLPTLLEGLQLEDCYLQVLGGCLCLYSKSRYDFTSNVVGNSSDYPLVTVFWVMKEYGVRESWTKFTVSDLERVPLSPVCLLGRVHVVLVKHSQLPKYMSNAVNKLVMYNMEEGTFKDIVVPFHIVQRFYAWCTYTESLVSPHYSNQSHSSERNPDENGRK